MKSLFDSIDKMQTVLDFHRDRHSVLAGNVANINTPGYTPFDVTLERLPGEAGSQLPLLRTVGEHLNAVDSGGGGGRLVFDDSSVSPSGDGNTVNLERELAKIDANRVRYGTTTELVSRRLALLRYGSGDGS